MKKRVLILTGNPGVGKTTLVLKLVDALKMLGYEIGGMISRELREGGDRVGFEILDIESGNKGVLASIKRDSGPRLGRYRVNLGDLENVGVEAIKNAILYAKIIVIDEVGPMELFSKPFKNVVEKTLESQKLLIIVVHWKANHPIISKIKDRKDAALFTVTIQNREKLEKQIVEKTLDYIQTK